jgi:hypothetical protein
MVATVAIGGALTIGSATGATAASAAATASGSASSNLVAAMAAGSAHASQPTASAANSGVTRACASALVAGHKSCFALKRNGVHAAATASAAVTPNAIPAGVGYGPVQLQAAYNLTSTSASNGAGRTIAVVDAYDYPNAAADLAAYRSAAGLPAATFTKVNQNGAASPLPAAAPSGDDWTLEAALDLDMASAICPLCSLVLVEAQDDSGTGLYVAQNAAASLAGYISNSWGGTEDATAPTLDSTYFTHASGIVTTASAGDSGYGVSYPATSPKVVSVGGTSLVTASNARGWSETVWGSAAGGEGTGSGCSGVEARPSWQSFLTSCADRVDNDVAADADPNTGVAVYDTSNGNTGWNEVGGTSASSPMLAAMYALAGNAGATPAQDIYQHASNFNDVTAGSDGSCSPSILCTAGVGYDGPTGYGTPNGIAGLVPATAGETVTVANPGSQSTTVNTAASKTITATDSAGKTLTFSATGLPTGLALSATGVVSGTPTTAGGYTVTVTASSGTASGSASFTWTILTPGSGCTAAQLLGNPGFETGSAAPWSTTAGVVNSNGAGETSHSGTWYAWLDGYGTTHTDTVSQTVTIPATCRTATYSFFLHIDTAETTTTTAFDKLTVQVVNSAGTATTLATYSNLNHVTGYSSFSFNLSSYIGQKITLKFTGTEDASLQTSFVVDDNALNVS